ncbi:protein HESO1-like [Oryza brachyantha]|uniref:Poly(A) RNA polymerase mitochondrial-like central palm domain-containing protein n=1 Tax=Oryza brachyantha TaxID=4533 RepID=J3L5S8_ORYBR|nr:protein HESO1-like [Oryza brachyantha]
MTESISNYDMGEQCIKNILSLIKPVEDDRMKRLYAIQELSNSIHKVAALRDAVFKPFGSFVSDLYSKSGDLDISVQLPNGTVSSITKQKKQYVLKELMRSLKSRGVAGQVQFIPYARVPVLQYVSNTSGISCDISINNYAGRIKSKIFKWISSLDARFSDMVLLVKEWAKAQNINDPKTGTLNSYSICLFVLFHFQTCEPAILPPLKDIYEGNIEEDIAETTGYDEEHLDEVCSANIENFQRENKEQRNESSLCHLLATFFRKFASIETLSGDVISTYTGQIKRIEENPSWMARSYSLFIEDPIERPDNAARAVCLRGLERIARAFTAANSKFASLEGASRNDLLEMMCTTAVVSKLVTRDSQEGTANSCTDTPGVSHQHARTMGHLPAGPSGNQNHHGTGGGSTVGSRVHTPPPRAYDTARQPTGGHRNRSQPAGVYQTAGPYQSNGHQQGYTRDLQETGHRNYSHPMAESHQSNGQAQVHATSIQAPRQYQNRSQQPPARSYNHQSSRPTETEGSWRNQQQKPTQYSNHSQQRPARNYSHQSSNPTTTEAGVHRTQQQRQQHTSGRQTNRNAVNTRHAPDAGRPPQNGPRPRESGTRVWRPKEPQTGRTNQNR